MKRAEADRDQLVIVLAGHPAAMHWLMLSNPGLASIFSPRIQFPGYSADELSSIAMLLAEKDGMRLVPPRHRPSTRSSATPARRGASTSSAMAGSPGLCSRAPVVTGTCAWCD